MGATATAPTKPRSEIDDEILAKELADAAGEEDDGLGGTPPVETEVPPEAQPEDPEDPNSEEATGVPGGRQPGDDGYVPPPGEPGGSAGNGGPPTPPASLPGGDDDGEEEAKAKEAAAKAEADQLSLAGFRPIGVKVGGNKPDSAVLKYKGGKLELGKSQFDRGDRFLTVDAWQVTGDNDQDTIVKLSGEVKSTSKAQSATLCGTTMLAEWVHARLSEGMSPHDVAAVCELLGIEGPGTGE